MDVRVKDTNMMLAATPKLHQRFEQMAAVPWIGLPMMIPNYKQIRETIGFDSDACAILCCPVRSGRSYV